jgi:hypothetical protein
MTAKEWIFENYPRVKEEWNKTGHDDNYMVRMMEEYHQAKLKLLGIGGVNNAERTLNDFFAYLDALGDKFDSNSLEGHKREWLKSFNDC